MASRKGDYFGLSYIVSLIHPHHFLGAWLAYKIFRG